jgi:hypothetical protein
MFVARLPGESVVDEFLDLSGCDVSSLKASVLRKDYDEVTRSLLGKALDEFNKTTASRQGGAGPLDHDAGLHGPPRKGLFR